MNDDLVTVTLDGDNAELVRVIAELRSLNTEGAVIWAVRYAARVYGYNKFVFRDVQPEDIISAD